MPEYLSPGVYVEEVSSGSRPIEGVSTTTAAFVGPTERGPLTPRLVTSWLDYQRWFGSYVDPQIYSKPMEAYTPYGVEGFFTNGGQRAYVARVVHDTDLVPANNSKTATLALDTEDAKVLLEVRAIGPGNWGGNLLLKLDPGSEAEPSNDDTKNLFRLTVLYYQNGVPQPFVDPTLAANQASSYFQAPDVSEAFDNLTIDPTATNDVITVVNRGSKLIRVGFVEKSSGPGGAEADTVPEPVWPEMPPSATGVVKVEVEGGTEASVSLTARQPGVWGNEVQFAFEAGTEKKGDELATPGKLELAWGFNPDEDNEDKGYAFVDANAEEYSTEMSLDDLVAAINARSKLVTAAPGEKAGKKKGALTGGTGTSIRALQLTDDDEPATASAAVQLTPDDEVELAAQFEGPLGDDIGFQAAVTDPDVSPEERRLTLRYPSNLGGTYLEVYTYTADTIDELKTNLGKSGLVEVVEIPSDESAEGEGEAEGAAPAAPLGSGSSQGWLAGGAPPIPEEPNPTPADFEGGGTPPDLTGLVGLGEIDGISMLVAPDAVNPKISNNRQISLALIEQCELLKDRFAVLSVEEGRSQVTNIRPIQDTSFGATYYPWIRIYNPRTDGILLVPPVGHVTGLYARNDIEKGVQHAPANEVVAGLYLSGDNPENGPLEFLIGKAQQDILNPRGIDVIRDFRPMGRGVRVWGARTMSSDPEWRYVNVRRLFLFVEQSIEQGTQWVVFEPNVEATWAAVVTSISGFLNQVWRSGGLAGTSPAEAYFVKCDRTTMTQDDIDNGRLICLVGIAPVKPAEFVIIRIGQKTLEAA